MIQKQRDLFLAALGFVLATGCDPDAPGDNGTGSTGQMGTDDDGGPGDGMSDVSTSDDDTMEGSTTSDGLADTGSGNPCDACDPIASCDAELCVCPQGYDGDGTSCADVDECAAGTADCDENATCANNEGSFECECDDGFVGDGQSCDAAASCADDPCDVNAICSDGATGPSCECNAGFEGEGRSCADIDECDQGAGPCDPNATCTNGNGDFDCACNDGFEGDGVSCLGALPYGETCEVAVPEPCASGLCVGLDYNHCTEFCNQAIANDCPNVGASGFCIAVNDTESVCVGEVDTGFDADDDILNAGDSATRLLDTLTDVDLFQLPLAAGNFLIQVTPDPDDDVQLEVHNALGQPIGVLNNGGDGFIEAAVLDTAGGMAFVLVRNIGNSTGSYTISVAAQ